MKEKTIKDMAKMGGKARWAKVPKEKRSKIMKDVSKGIKFSRRKKILTA